MGKLYTKKIPKGEKLNELRPEKETIDFLLNYSKSLRFTEYQNMKFKMLLN